jgi:hypothetical protein
MACGYITAHCTLHGLSLLPTIAESYPEAYAVDFLSDFLSQDKPVGKMQLLP